MPSSSKPLITVVGALSKQGRSVARTLLESGRGRYRVRALTRRADAPEARTLAELGAELVAVPLELGHTEELVNAFRGLAELGFVRCRRRDGRRHEERAVRASRLTQPSRQEYSTSSSPVSKTSTKLPAARNLPRTSLTKPGSRSTSAPCPSPAHLFTWRISIQISWSTTNRA